MDKSLYKLAKGGSGFTLTEVMIGIMILTIAIVAASNLLISLVSTNKANVQTLKAYYFAQEGIELVRNIRDTNWLHNVGFQDGTIGEGFAELTKGNSYGIFVDKQGWEQSRPDDAIDQKNQLLAFVPWEILGSIPTNNVDSFNDSFKISLKDEGNDAYFGSGNEGTDFYRHIDIVDACGGEAHLAHDVDPMMDNCGDFVLVRSVVNWKKGGSDKELVIEALLTNWKGGAL